MSKYLQCNRCEADAVAVVGFTTDAGPCETGACPDHMIEVMELLRDGMRTAQEWIADNVKETTADEVWPQCLQQ